MAVGQLLTSSNNVKTTALKASMLDACRGTDHTVLEVASMVMLRVAATSLSPHMWLDKVSLDLDVVPAGPDRAWDTLGCVAKQLAVVAVALWLLVCRACCWCCWCCCRFVCPPAAVAGGGA